MISPPAAALAQAAGATVSPVQNVDDAEGATGEVIVVTARKREEAALDVPMSISVLSGDRLEKLGVRNLRDVGSLFPGVSFRSEEHTSELQSLMRISYAVFCLKKQNPNNIS